jgi:hypothetical protein
VCEKSNLKKKQLFVDILTQQVSFNIFFYTATLNVTQLKNSFWIASFLSFQMHAVVRSLVTIPCYHLTILATKLYILLL